eukprot:TRINITY_DN14019_c0_g1_i1.p1 TRINITY_DN14019_c0_g1~~TRINITY_DN14019_c0_g1_i1.p1  ORF type:complete len:210 (-),score=32.20 TRINITY_DN14019_c0_g1_i1:11-553(-)
MPLEDNTPPPEQWWPTTTTQLSVHGHRFCILHNTEEDTRGIFLHRIPFSHPSQLHAILKILRRQLVFNELYCSLLGQSSQEKDVARSEKEGEVRLVLEVRARSPSHISVTVPNILSRHMDIMEIKVGENGVVEAQLVNAGKDEHALASNAQLTEMLRVTRHIPLLLRTLHVRARVRSAAH